ncbi:MULTISPECIES: DNA topoisomerase I [Metallibacterium]|jgi:DNA topoisomerase-1|uniref:DNA topoisomerase I n=1 Tax=Metallibacterium TaxID=1218803 RepID=UPI002639085B|nr:MULTISPECIES: DNA topoisomerase I [Metallibacterium]MBW8075839.1 DNA topoisomerase I [Metallibacterium scheffleri]
MAKNLLIVESPAKAKTINKYLGKDFEVLASYGHVRDLVPKEGAVDPEHGFAMRYALIDKNEKHVDAIARAAGKAEAIYLATDLDREGEAISWHISEILRERGLLDGRRVQRVVFSEITPRAIHEAVANPREISHDLVDAQQARRALDYLVGFNLSPVLWRKVQRGLSAGRVQSPALRMIVEREEEIEAFKAREYWSLDAQLAHAGVAFTARLSKLKGKKFEQFDITDAGGAHAARAALLAAAGGRLVVSEVQSKERKRRAAPPFTTSTLQQEAARKLGFATSRTMRVAQGLYEGVALGDEGNVGLISYMRTDSVSLSAEALSELRQVIAREYGAQAVPEKPNFYQTKSKNAQEAHEAIRPTSALRTPKSIAAFLNDDQRKLYELIWKRAVASQMIPATLNTVSVDLACGADSAFRASGTTVVDPGFLAVYEEGRDQKADDDEAERKLPALQAGTSVPLADILAEQHFTEPPPRYSEASLVKALEEYGIGRPSTYASIIQVLLAREYVLLDQRRFRPTDVGRAVGKFLSQHFAQYVDYDFTARLEDELDAVSRGEEDWVPLLQKFWTPFKQQVEQKTESVERSEATGARAIGTDPVSGKAVSVRLGRYGAFAQIGLKEAGDTPRYASLRPGQSMHTITLAEALELFKLPRTLGTSPEGEAVSVGIGRFGPFVKQGDTYASLGKEDDPYSIDLAHALALLQAKREAAANRIIKDFGNGVQVLNGRYGPYITDGEKNARIPKDREPASLSAEECIALLAAAPTKPKRGTARGGAARKTSGKQTAGKAGAPAKQAVAKTAPVSKVAAKKTAIKKAAVKTSAARSGTRGGGT